MELNSKIVRPVVSIVRFGASSITYSVTSPGWSNEYQRCKTFDNVHKTKKLAKAFSEHFDQLAARIEDGTDRPYAIMRMFVQRRIFYSVRKLSIDPSTI